MTEFSNENTEPTEVDSTVSDESGAPADKYADLKTVRDYRHAAKAALARGREALALRNDLTKEVYLLINGAIEEILRGRQGLSQEEQVEHLDSALTKVADAKAALPEKIAAAKAAVLAQTESWEIDITAEAEAAFSILRAGKEFAANRDFAAHQATKHQSVYTPDDSDYASAEDESEDGDFDLEW